MSLDPRAIVKPIAAAVASVPVAGSLNDAWQAVLGDRIAVWRLINAAKLQPKINEELNKLGLVLKREKIPERYAFGWFEEATKQDDPDIQQLFARLIAKASVGDPDASDERHIEILTRLVPMDAAVMKSILPSLDPNILPNDKIPKLWKQTDRSLRTNVDAAFGVEAWRSVEHLISLGVFEQETEMNNRTVQQIIEHIARNPRAVPDVGRAAVLHRTINLTATGWSLFRALREMP